MKLLRKWLSKYFDYDIVGRYFEYKNGKYVKKYIRKYKLRKKDNNADS